MVNPVSTYIGKDVCGKCGLVGSRTNFSYISKGKESISVLFKHFVFGNGKFYKCYYRITPKIVTQKKISIKRFPCTIRGCSTNFESIKALREHKDKEHRI